MSLLPLFPLELVLFPDTPLPLHIFEPRYREMIRECRAAKKPFGIVCATGDKIAHIGCTAEIVKILEEPSDGRLDILTEGRRRFEVIKVNRERNFPQADVLYFEDDGEPADHAESLRMMELHEELLQFTTADVSQPDPHEPQPVFSLAATLPLDLGFKQALLSMRSEQERVEAMIQCYETLLPKLRRTMQARKSSGGNGHVQ